MKSVLIVVGVLCFFSSLNAALTIQIGKNPGVLAVSPLDFFVSGKIAPLSYLLLTYGEIPIHMRCNIAKTKK